MAVTTPSARHIEWDDDLLDTKGNYMTTITPEIAERLLERNVRNRKEKPTAIRRYAASMEAGNWDPEAASIAFAKNGDLIDGQNRLLACVQSGKPFGTMVRTGLKPDTMRHIDLGIRRSVTDTFKVEGVKYATGTSGSIAMRVRYEEAEANGRKIGQTLDIKGVRLDPDEAMEYLQSHPVHSAVGADSFALYKMAPRIKQTVWQTFLSMAVETDADAAKQFTERMLRGELGGQGDPFAALMRYLAKPRDVRPGHRVRNPQERDLLVLIKAWNAWRMEQPVVTLAVGDNDQLEPMV